MVYPNLVYNFFLFVCLFVCFSLFVFDISCVIWLITIILSILMIIHVTPRPLFQILSTRHIITLTNLVCWIGLIRINICRSLNTMNKTGIIITTLHRVNGDATPPSLIVNHLTNVQLHILLLSNNH